METDNKIIIELSQKLLSSKPFNNTYSEEDWASAFKKSSQQNITALMASVILELPKDFQPENISKWKNALIQTVYLMSIKNVEFEKVVKLLSEAGVTPLCLKGTVVKDLYPTPELRTMGDFDILINADERKAAEDVLCQNGYKITRDTLFSEIDKNGVHGEMFISLEADFRLEPEYWDKELRQNTYLCKDRLLLLPTYELAYSVIHLAKHLLQEGAGIRNLFDLILLLQKRENIDLKTVEKVCKSQNCEKVFYYMLSAAKHFYNINIEDEFPSPDGEHVQEFVEYMLSYGIFGNPPNVLTTQMVKREGRNVSTFRRIFFPPREMMWHKYQYLKKSPLLLPIAWTHRFINSVFIKKYSVKGMVTGINESINFSKEHEKRLDDLGLK